MRETKSLGMAAIQIQHALRRARFFRQQCPRLTFRGQETPRIQRSKGRSRSHAGTDLSKWLKAASTVSFPKLYEADTLVNQFTTAHRMPRNSVWRRKSKVCMHNNSATTGRLQERLRRHATSYGTRRRQAVRHFCWRSDLFFAATLTPCEKKMPLNMYAHPRVVQLDLTVLLYPAKQVMPTHAQFWHVHALRLLLFLSRNKYLSSRACKKLEKAGKKSARKGKRRVCICVPNTKGSTAGMPHLSIRYICNFNTTDSQACAKRTLAPAAHPDNKAKDGPGKTYQTCVARASSGSTTSLILFQFECPVLT